MAYNSYNKLWENEFDNTVSIKDKVQEIDINQSKLEVYDTFKKDKNSITIFENPYNEDVINKADLDEKIFKK